MFGSVVSMSCWCCCWMLLFDKRLQDCKEEEGKKKETGSLSPPTTLPGHATVLRLLMSAYLGG